MTEYIKSKDLTLLIRDAFKLIDKRLMDHGTKTAYIFCKMLECMDKYEKFEIADFSILATLHDIGAYKTDNLNDMLRFEAKDYLPHSIYGYLFLKCLSPFEDISKIILYHNSDYSKIKNFDYGYIEEASCLNLAEKVAIYHTALRDRFNPSMFNQYAGTKYSDMAIQLFAEAIEKHNVIERLNSGEYLEDLEDIVDYVIFSDDEKNKYLQMLMYCTGFRSENSVVDTVTTICVCKEIATYMGCSKSDKELLYYGALVHDIGMLAIPYSIIEATRKLTPEEYARMQKHVEIEEEMFEGRLIPEVIKIATAHHERGDGSGYPKKLKESQMNILQGILQVADTVTGLVNKRSYRVPHSKESVISILKEDSGKRKYRKDVVDVFVTYYDEIMGVVSRESEEILSTHRKIKIQYEQVYKALNQNR